MAKNVKLKDDFQEQVDNFIMDRFSTADMSDEDIFSILDSWDLRVQSVMSNLGQNRRAAMHTIIFNDPNLHDLRALAMGN